MGHLFIYYTEASGSLECSDVRGIALDCLARRLVMPLRKPWCCLWRLPGTFILSWSLCLAWCFTNIMNPELAITLTGAAKKE